MLRVKVVHSTETLKWLGSIFMITVNKSVYCIIRRKLFQQALVYRGYLSHEFARYIVIAGSDENLIH
mgnify:CR=1 FL=1